VHDLNVARDGSCLHIGGTSLDWDDHHLIEGAPHMVDLVLKELLPA